MGNQFMITQRVPRISPRSAFRLDEALDRDSPYPREALLGVPARCVLDLSQVWQCHAMVIEYLQVPTFFTLTVDAPLDFKSESILFFLD